MIVIVHPSPNSADFSLNSSEYEDDDPLHKPYANSDHGDYSCFQFIPFRAICVVLRGDNPPGVRLNGYALYGVWFLVVEPGMISA